MTDSALWLIWKLANLFVNPQVPIPAQGQVSVGKGSEPRGGVVCVESMGVWDNNDKNNNAEIEQLAFTEPSLCQEP